VSKKFDWDKARQFKQYESKVRPGTVLPNGRRIPQPPPRDELARKADGAMREWLRDLSPRDRRAFRSVVSSAPSAAAKPTARSVWAICANYSDRATVQPFPMTTPAAKICTNSCCRFRSDQTPT
jgi:hypothetical protein